MLRESAQPAVNQSIYDALYVTFDPTRFDPPGGDDGMAESGGVAQTHERRSREAGSVVIRENGGRMSVIFNPTAEEPARSRPSSLSFRASRTSWSRTIRS